MQKKFYYYCVTRNIFTFLLYVTNVTDFLKIKFFLEINQKYVLAFIGFSSTFEFKPARFQAFGRIQQQILFHFYCIQNEKVHFK